MNNSTVGSVPTSFSSATSITTSAYASSSSAIGLTTAQGTGKILRENWQAPFHFRPNHRRTPLVFEPAMKRLGIQHLQNKYDLAAPVRHRPNRDCGGCFLSCLRLLRASNRCRPQSGTSVNGFAGGRAKASPGAKGVVRSLRTEPQRHPNSWQRQGLVGKGAQYI